MAGETFDIRAADSLAPSEHSDARRHSRNSRRDPDVRNGAPDPTDRADAERGAEAKTLRVACLRLPWQNKERSRALPAGTVCRGSPLDRDGRRESARSVRSRGGSVPSAAPCVRIDRREVESLHGTMTAGSRFSTDPRCLK